MIKYLENEMTRLDNNIFIIKMAALLGYIYLTFSMDKSYGFFINKYLILSKYL
jgi:hypothetical protein